MDALIGLVVIVGIAAYLVYKVRPDLWAKLTARFKRGE